MLMPLACLLGLMAKATRTERYYTEEEFLVTLTYLIFKKMSSRNLTRFSYYRD